MADKNGIFLMLMMLMGRNKNPQMYIMYTVSAQYLTEVHKLTQ